ncbi:MAG: metallophosphoesterase family protein [Candidatus Taylorbacteria bacterium]|nr:metallophosphoesterase family protein [Candidatus Taylorbacteria bacterium]
MIVGIISDTHNDKNNAIPHIMKEFRRRGVKQIVHCGDIISDHVKAELFDDLPVTCALVDDQGEEPAFLDLSNKKPSNWEFTRTGKRFTKISELKAYVGHKLNLNFLRLTVEKFNEILTNLREKCDGLRIVFGGHLHFQTYKQGQLVSFINPGAVEDALGWGYEYAIMDTENYQVVFGRILPIPDDRPIFSIGVISDSLDITHRDPNYWARLAQEFKSRDVTKIIHCGNIAIEDIGRKELKDFFVYYAIRSDQTYKHSILVKEGTIPENWKVISETNLDKGATVEINGYRFYVQLNLGLEFINVSEYGMDLKAMKIRDAYPETEFVLCGFTREALLVEGQQVITINPGDVNTDRSFVVICLPRHEITFGHVPHDPLPNVV